MPKQTFFNLPEHKKLRLIEAAEKEFIRVPLHEASIANIIKTAEISRGSFYQYFDDKDDLYEYLLEEKLKELKNFFISCLEKYQGDLIEATTVMYNAFLKSLSDEEEKKFLENAVLHTTYWVESSFTSMFDTYMEEEELVDFSGLIEKKYLNIKDERELIHVFKIIVALAFSNLIEKTVKGLSDEEAIESFKLSMNLIKIGLYK